MLECTKADWKLFREKVPGWQDAYMARLNKEYIELLQGNGNASDKFWALEKRIKEDRKSPGVIIEMRRSTMALNLLRLLQDGAICEEDLEGFSEDVRDAVVEMWKRWRE